MPNEQADANVIVKPCDSWTKQEEEVCRDVESIVGSDKLDAVLCVRNIAFIAVLHFSHSRAFINVNNSYPKMSVKRHLTCS
jgi:hypothetical protein